MLVNQISKRVNQRVDKLEHSAEVFETRQNLWKRSAYASCGNKILCDGLIDLHIRGKLPTSTTQSNWLEESHSTARHCPVFPLRIGFVSASSNIQCHWAGRARFQTSMGSSMVLSSCQYGRCNAVFGKTGLLLTHEWSRAKQHASKDVEPNRTKLYICSKADRKHGA
eukprot:717701-Amphidinium_carterae.1